MTAAGARASRARPSVAAVVVAAGVASLAACSTIVDLAGVPHAGVQSDGSYVPTAEEHALDCRQLAVVVNEAVTRTKDLTGAVPGELKRGPSNLVALFGQLGNSDSRGLTTVANYQKSRQRAETLVGLMRAKGCQPVDIDTPLKESDLIIEAARSSR